MTRNTEQRQQGGQATPSLFCRHVFHLTFPTKPWDPELLPSLLTGGRFRTLSVAPKCSPSHHSPRGTYMDTACQAAKSQERGVHGAAVCGRDARPSDPGVWSAMRRMGTWGRACLPVYTPRSIQMRNRACGQVVPAQPHCEKVLALLGPGWPQRTHQRGPLEPSCLPLSCFPPLCLPDSPQ